MNSQCLWFNPLRFSTFFQTRRFSKSTRIRSINGEDKIVELEELQSYLPLRLNENLENSKNHFERVPFLTRIKNEERKSKAFPAQLLSNSVFSPSLKIHSSPQTLPPSQSTILTLPAPLSEATSNAQSQESSHEQPVTFAELRLPAWLQAALSLCNIHHPTPLQRRIIMSILAKDDVEKSQGSNNIDSPRIRKALLVQAQTGTGKSMAYIIALLARLHQEHTLTGHHYNTHKAQYNCTTLLLVPNVILGLQLLRWIHSLVKVDEYWRTRFLDIARIALPGPAQEMADSLLDVAIPSETTSPAPSYLLISTPSRMNELLAQGQWQWQRIREVIIDEVDAQLKPLSAYATAKEKAHHRKHPPSLETFLTRLTSLCHEHEISRLPRLIAASATLNERCRRTLRRLTGPLMKKMLLVQDTTPIKQTHSAHLTCPSTIRHYYRMLQDADSIEELAQLIKTITNQFSQDTGVLFVPATKSKTAIQRILQAVGVSSQLLSQFRYGNSSNEEEASQRSKGKLLIGSDIDARGWDLPSLSYVIIIDLPETPAHYVHMAGRVGRLGSGTCTSSNRLGTVYTMVAGSKDLQRLAGIYSMLGLRPTPLQVESCYLPNNNESIPDQRITLDSKTIETPSQSYLASS